jgi:hypothetical protein
VKEWIRKIKTDLENGVDVRLIWMIENFEILLWKRGDQYHLQRRHSSKDISNGIITATLDSIIADLEHYEKPNEIITE